MSIVVVSCHSLPVWSSIDYCRVTLWEHIGIYICAQSAASAPAGASDVYHVLSRIIVPCFIHVKYMYHV